MTSFAKGILACVFVAVFLIGCKPKPPFLEDTPDGPPKFQQGWKDGCETGLAMTGNSVYKNFYKFKQDPYGAQDIVYYKGWKDAMWFCSRRVEMWLMRRVDDVSLLPKLDSMSWSADREHSVWDWFGWGGMKNNPMAERAWWDGLLPDEDMLIPMTLDGKY